MPNTVQNFNINAQGDVTPNGNGAEMSITNANNQPNQGQWHTASHEAVIKLPSTVWDVTANDGSAYVFTVAANSQTPTFNLKTTAPLGPQMYDVEAGPNPKGGGTRPTVIINP